MDRIEKDFLGEKQINKNALYGIHSLRARDNFPDNTPFHIEWYKAIGLTKLACYMTYDSFKKAVLEKHPDNDLPINLFDKSIITALIESAEEVAEGKYFNHFIVPAIQGGAGTSINMNVNEIAEDRLYKSPAITTTLSPYIGYNNAAKLAKEMKKSKKDIFSVNGKLKLIEPEKLEKILVPQNLLKMGFTLKDITE